MDEYGPRPVWWRSISSSGSLSSDMMMMTRKALLTKSILKVLRQKKCFITMCKFKIYYSLFLHRVGVCAPVTGRRYRLRAHECAGADGIAPNKRYLRRYFTLSLINEYCFLFSITILLLT